MKYQALSTLALLTLTLGACSNGKSSPTEPAFDLQSSPAAVTAPAPSGDKRHGADDPAGDDRGGRNGGQGADDPAGDDRGGRRGRGADDPAGDDRGGRRGGNGNQNQRPARGAEFEGRVVAVDGGTLTLATGQRVVVNGQTQFAARGDLRTLAQVASSVSSGANTRVEGRGARQADGTIVAASIKAEVDR